VQEEKFGSLPVQDAEQTQNTNVCLVQLNELSYAPNMRNRIRSYRHCTAICRKSRNINRVLINRH